MAAPPIAILGAGPGGLTLARLLHLHDIPFTVFERDETRTSRSQWAGSLDIHTETGQAALHACGLFDEFRKLARYEGQAMNAVDGDGTPIWVTSGEDEEGRPEIDRPQLRSLLLDSLPESTVKWGRKVVDVFHDAYHENCESMTVKFDDGSVEKGFRLVVGADGAWSKARSLLTSDTPTYSGVSMVQTIISPSNPNYAKCSSLCGSGMYLALSKGNSVIAQRMSSGSYNVYTGQQISHADAVAEAEKLASLEYREKFVGTELKRWVKQTTDLILSGDEGPFHAWPLYTMSTSSFPWQHVPGVALIGDAAHLTTPNGEGVNLAMLDALKLAEAITSGANNGSLASLDEAVKQYESEMFPRAIAHIEDGKQMQEMFYASDSPRGFREWVGKIVGNGEGDGS